MHTLVRQQLLSVLWPAGQSSRTDVFAVLDGARDARIVRRLDDYLDTKACLYAGALTPELQNAAPHIMRLFRDDGYCRALLDDGWGNAWGVFLHSELSLPSLRKHLRRFLIVQGPRGGRLIFRWYDPRVLRIYLPTCNAHELRTVFGPINAFVAEGREPGTAHHFSFDGIRLTNTLVRFAS